MRGSEGAGRRTSPRRNPHGVPGLSNQRKQPLQGGLDIRPISRGQETRTPRDESLFHRLRFIHSYPARRLESGVLPIGHLNIVLAPRTSGRCWNDHDVRISSVKEHSDGTRLRLRATGKRIIDDNNLPRTIGRHALFRSRLRSIPLRVAFQKFACAQLRPLVILVQRLLRGRIFALPANPTPQV